ncbi:MAG TPA: FAD:protein FMN transferase, partial [Pseudomonadales bacterium]|nr:FAD:protein FMN transferase [Pseudomonadales bacterium]
MLAVLDCVSTPPALSQVPQWFEEWEQVLSRFRYNSELTLLNQKHEQPVQVSQILWDVFQSAREAERMTNGLVTPTLLDAIIEAGYDRPFEELPHLATLTPVTVKTSVPSLKEIAINDIARTIT